MAMNAYRNYNTNTSALSSNLEKLSSGYKINRAGDDAAGLAISEKMRAQISGLDQAESNVKDGISLVKTGEGALQEVQDMLNRMVTLATQSANGTYDDDTDRAQLQKEVDSLTAEIDRIADSSNFNGIQLLDGSLANGLDTTSAGNMTVGGLLPEVGETLGTNTVLHLEEDPNITSGSKFTVDLNNLSWNAGATGDNLKLTIGDKTFTITATKAGEMTGATIAQKLKAQLTATSAGQVKIGDNKFTLQAANGTKADQIKVTQTGSTIVFEQTKTPTADDNVLDPAQTFKITVDGKGSFGTVTAKGQDYNVSSTNITKVTLADAARLASTSFTLTSDMAAAGATLTLGNQTIYFTDDDTKKTDQANGYVYVGDLDLSTDAGLSQAASRLTATANANTGKTSQGVSGNIFTVGYDGTKITLTEKDGSIDYTDAKRTFDLSTKEGLESALSYQGVASSGKSLMLQIGDTSKSYNQLYVSIEDMHASALGIDKIDISTQDGASAAIDVIKNAINQVSSTRGTLGATQNRLEHTQNNLSVMAENIQDAESTIRDTDIAEEMMSYTKNNILVQSAQAMLAQANSVPQGVLQLLQ
jgi:flagellin